MQEDPETAVNPAETLALLSQLENEWARIRQETQQDDDQATASAFPLWQVVTQP